MSVLSRLLHRDVPARGLEILPMRRRDFTAIQVIEHQVYPQPWSINVFLNEIELAKQGQRYYTVGYRGGELMGYAGMMLVLEEAHITNIATDPKRRRSGIARHLLADLAWEARRKGCTGLTLEVRISNVAAQGLYHLFGFEPAGVRPRYYENSEDAIVMWCHNIDSPEYAARLRLLCPDVAEIRGES